mgnify:CR=1 FL=1
MQPAYLYTSDFDQEVLWRSKFSTVIPVLLGFLQMLVTFVIIGLEIAATVVSPILGTLYAGFWCSVVFVLSWLSLISLACCHRARKWATFAFVISILCAATAITLIVLDALFIGNITRCFFADVICKDLRSTYPQVNSQPLGRKVLILKAQIACTALLLLTAILYILYYISVLRSVRHGTTRIVVDQQNAPARLVRRLSSPSSPIPPPTNHTWKTTTAPTVVHDSNSIQCPHCSTMIRLTQPKRYN